jgi:hypothetical protein
VESQSADNRNWLAAIVSIAGISFLLPYELVSVCQFPLSANRGKIKEPVSSGKYGKVISHESAWAFRYQCFTGALYRYK